MNTDAFLPYVSLVRELSRSPTSIHVPTALRNASAAALCGAALRSLRRMVSLDRMAKAVEQPVSMSRTYALWHRMLDT
jgi:hypothetical protein